MKKTRTNFAAEGLDRSARQEIGATREVRSEQVDPADSFKDTAKARDCARGRYLAFRIVSYRGAISENLSQPRCPAIQREQRVPSAK
jgi:hypothetical protein